MIDIQQLIEADRNLLLALNGSHSLFWDGFMWVVTSTVTWVPAAIILLYVIFRNNKLPQSIFILLMIALVITLADQLASSVSPILPVSGRLRIQRLCTWFIR